MNRLWFNYYAGKLLNLMGWPSPVRESNYESPALNAQVSVKKLELYTVVSVNGLDVYFDRLTGAIKGVGCSPVIEARMPVTLMPVGLAKNKKRFSFRHRHAA